MYDFIFHATTSEVHYSDGPFPKRLAVMSLLIPQNSDKAFIVTQGVSQEMPRSDWEHAIGVVEGVLNEPSLIVEGNETGLYFSHWSVCGRIGEKTFNLNVDFVAPGERWTEVGSRLNGLVRGLNKSATNQES